MQEVIKIPVFDENVLGYLKTPDGLVILLRDEPITFEIAKKHLDILEKRLKES